MSETNFTPNLGEVFMTHSAPVPLFQFNGAPSGYAPEGAIGLDTSTGDFYEMESGTWTLLFSSGGGGGTTQIATGSSDPVGAPAAGIVFFSRTDIVRVLRWSGSAWDVVASE